MSHDATNWAIKQRGIKPALKVVLWNLCDRYHPDNGCFPRQDTLAADCELPRSTLNVYLKELEEAGLILREQRRERGSNRQESTRYRFPFEPDFPGVPAQKPCPETGHGAESRNEGEPSPEIGKSRVQNLDTNPVREPVREPVNEREGACEAQEGEGEEGPKAVLRRFRAWWRTMPAYALETESDVWAEWLALSPDQRKACEERTPAWLVAWRQAKRSTAKASKNYLKERLWERVGEAETRAALAASHAPEPSNPFSKAWMGAAFWTLLGPEKPLPQARGMLASIMARDDEVGERERVQYRQRHAWPVLAGPEGQFERPRRIVVPADVTAFSDDFHSYRVAPEAAPEVAIWRTLFEQMGWPWPRTGSAEWLCLPPLDSLDDEAAWRALDGLRERMRKVRGDEHAA